MARAWIYEGVQIGVEGSGTPGTSVAADRKLSSLQITPTVQVDIAKYRASGFKFPTVQALNREWVEASISGPITYTEIVYLLASILKNVTPSGVGPEKTWVFDPASAAADDVATYTVEYGSATRAEKFTYGLVSALTMRFNNNGAELDGTILGQAIQDNITLTATPTTVDLVPVTRPHVTLKLADTHAGLDAAQAISYGFSVEWSLTNRFSPIWALTGSTDWNEHVEIEPQLQVRLLIQADATGMGLLTHMRNGSYQFLRIGCTGPNVDTEPHELKIDTALKVMDVSDPRDQEGVAAAEWTFAGFHDPTWGAATEVTVVNELTAL